ncbi:hypothetical protein [Donghicola mangrovi]|uniref:hypothetical protein n=1 Tax=Donghicola mangrovi TaxID=2729614 RepID=UPI0018853F23|nr:hypothetical protein [Donghicola mangrovi]
MLSILDLLGTIGAAALGLPGILGVALGMTTRNPLVAGLLAAMVGVVSPLVLGGSHSTHVAITPLEYGVALVIGALAGLVGCAIRRKGATV